MRTGRKIGVWDSTEACVWSACHLLRVTSLLSQRVLQTIYSAG